MLNALPVFPRGAWPSLTIETCAIGRQYRAIEVQFVENRTALHNPVGLLDSASILVPQDRLQFASIPKNKLVATTTHPATITAVSPAIANKLRCFWFMTATTAALAITAIVVTHMGAINSRYFHSPNQRIDNRYPVKVAHPIAKAKNSNV